MSIECMFVGECFCDTKCIDIHKFAFTQSAYNFQTDSFKWVTLVQYMIN